MNKEQLIKKREEINKKIEQLELQEKMKLSEQKLIKIKMPYGIIEVQKNFDQKDLMIKDIKVPDEFRFLTFDEFRECYLNNFNKFNWGKRLDEICLNPFAKKGDKYIYWNMYKRLARLDGDSAVCGYGDLDGDGTVRGVRFCKDVKK